MGDFQPTESIILTAAAPDTGKSCKILIFWPEQFGFFKTCQLFFALPTKLNLFGLLCLLFFTHLLCVSILSYIQKLQKRQTHCNVSEKLVLQHFQSQIIGHFPAVWLVKAWQSGCRKSLVCPKTYQVLLESDIQCCYCRNYFRKCCYLAKIQSSRQHFVTSAFRMNKMFPYHQ